MNTKIDSPVMKSFAESDKYYLYDTYTNSLLSIQKEHFIELNKLQKLGLKEYMDSQDSSVAHDDIIHLIDKGLLKSDFVKDLMHPLQNYISDLCSRSINDISLQVTKNCNMKCRYCLFATDTPFERNHEKVNMSWDLAKKSIDFLHSKSKDAASLNISFYGGEPLINFELISLVVDYAEQLFYTKKIDYIMTINGLLLNEKIIDFLAAHNFSLSISLDENENVHNRHRKTGATGNGTYDIVKRNVEIIKERHNDYFFNRVSFIPVLFPDETYDYDSSIFKQLSVKEENISPTDVNLQGIDYVYSDINDVSIKQDEKENERLEELFKKKYRIPSVWYPNGQCVPGVKRLFIDTDGIFYPCEKVVEQSGLSIGNIYDGLDLDAIDHFLNVARLTENDCKHCWAMRFCSMCISDCSDTERGINVEKRRAICEMYKKSALLFLRRCAKRRFKP